MSACGGGGTDEATSVSTLSFPLAQSLRNFYANGEVGQYSVVLTAGSTTCNGTVTLTRSKATAATFENVNGVSSTQTATVQFTNSTWAQRPTRASAILDSNFNPIGSTATGEYRVYQTPKPQLPTLAKIGDSFTLGTAFTYTGAAKTTQIGKDVTTYSMQADTGSTARLVMTTTETDQANHPVSTTVEAVRIDATGGYKTLSVNVTVQGSGRVVMTRTD